MWYSVFDMAKYYRRERRRKLKSGEGEEEVRAATLDLWKIGNLSKRQFCISQQNNCVNIEFLIGKKNDLDT